MGSEKKMQVVEMRLSQMEEFLEDSMRSTVSRSKEMRNRLTLIEDLLKGQRDATGGGGFGAAVSGAIMSGQSNLSTGSMPPPQYLAGYDARAGRDSNRFRMADRQGTPTGARTPTGRTGV